MKIDEIIKELEKLSKSFRETILDIADDISDQIAVNPTKDSVSIDIHCDRSKLDAVRFILGKEVFSIPEKPTLAHGRIYPEIIKVTKIDKVLKNGLRYAYNRRGEEVEKGKSIPHPEVSKPVEEEPCFNKETGYLYFDGKSAKFRRSSFYYKLINFLYYHPNETFDYGRIGYEIGIIDSIIKRKDPSKYSEWIEKVKQFKDEGITKFLEEVFIKDPPTLTILKKRINDYVNEIKTRLGLPKKDERLFVCNEGYMMIRKDKKDSVSK